MKGKAQQQKQVTISAYSMEVIQESFTSTLKWLEFYIEKSGYSGNWQRQISETITRQDLNDQPSEIRGFMETALLGLNGLIENKPDFVLENLQEKFYSWLAKSGIGIDDCPEGLVECLVDIHKVLNNEGKEFSERVSEEAGENIAKMTPEERRKNFYRTFTVAQRLMDVASARQKSLEGKTYKDVEMKNQFSGNPDQGKKLFGQIEGRQSASSTNLNEIVQDVKNNSQNWSVDEIITEFNNFGGTKQEVMLIHKGVRLHDYNQEGKLNFNRNPIYRWENFNSYQRFEIKRAKNISGDYLTNEEIKWVVREVKSSPNIWRIEVIKGQTYLIHNLAQVNDGEIGTLIHSWQKFSEVEWAEINGAVKRAKLIEDIKQNAHLEKGLFVINRETGEYSENEDWFIHNQLRREFDNKTGYLINVPSFMVKAKDLTEKEQKEVGYKSEQRLKNLSTFGTKNDNKDIGTGGIFAIIAVVSALLIASVVVVKKRLSKKVKSR